MNALEQLERDRRNSANVQAYTAAVGWTGLFNGFAGKDGRQSHPSELLPYPQESTESKVRSISKRTAEIFVRLTREGKLPPKILGAAAQIMDEILELTN